ncbi:MAG: efflux RND transporter permease subunit [Dehalococcoidia bacterium]|nr:efflux RND transporter permease subunit [Dehalococcoidia bacterium]
MTFLTGIAVRNRTVTVLAIILVLTAGITAYRSLQVELFPEIEFPLVTVSTSYPSANPDAVVRDVTDPIERAISGTAGLESIQSRTFEGNSIVLATFAYGTDMAAAQTQISAAVNDISFVSGVEEPTVGRFNPDQFPVIEFSVISDREAADLQDIVQSQVLPALSDVEGILEVDATGEIERRVQITVDAERLAANGVSLFQISNALRENNVSLPAGAIFEGGQAVLAKTTHTFSSIDDLKALVVGMSETGPVLLGDVADVSLGTAAPRSISRTNGKPSVGVSIVKEAEANTIDVTSAVREALDGLTGLPSDVEIVIVSDQGPSIQHQIDTLLREAMFGFLFAVTVVFAFMLTLKPTIPRGLLNTLRPTVVIALSIPLSVFTGVLLMAWQDMSLNFMTLGGLAISVGRVVDDAIVVLENVYRHIQAGRERWRAALQATAEVGPAIFASTMTTIVVFAPLAFIQGLVGAFFTPFALTVSFALVASLLVALTAVPVLGAYLLRPGDLPEGAGEEDDTFVQETWMQRVYTPIIRWTLRHKAITLVSAFVLTVGSMGLTFFIPVTLFPSGADRFVQIELSLPPGTPPDRTLAQVVEIEDRVKDISRVYRSTIGASSLSFGGVPGGLNQAGILVNLSDDAPENIAEILREELDTGGRTLRIREVQSGPPTSGLDVRITGSNYDDIVAVSQELAASIGEVEGVINVETNVAQARDEASIQVDPAKAASIGLSTRQVGLQVSQYLIGETVTRITIDDAVTDVVLSGDRRAAIGIGAVESLIIAGPLGSAPLGDLAEVVVKEGPVTISRTDGLRSATITGDIVAEDAQQVGRLIDEKIAAIALPPGVSITSGGLFADIAEGFQAIFISMAVGIVLVYLVMVTSLGSLRNPIVIVTTLPFALIGALAALVITDRSLGLPAMMGILLLIGIVVTNAIVLIAFVEQLREKGMSVYDALINGGRVRLRPILMTALTTSFALLPLAAAPSDEGGIISAELATVVIGGLMSSTGLTLIVVPVVYSIFNESIPNTFRRIVGALSRKPVAAT